MMWERLAEDEKMRLVRNMADHLSRASDFIQVNFSITFV